MMFDSGRSRTSLNIFFYRHRNPPDFLNLAFIIVLKGQNNLSASCGNIPGIKTCQISGRSGNVVETPACHRPQSCQGFYIDRKCGEEPLRPVRDAILGHIIFSTPILCLRQIKTYFLFPRDVATLYSQA